MFPRIAIAIKDFLVPSPLSEFHTALGQFLNYRSALQRFEPERILYLAIPVDIYMTFFTEELTQMSIQDYHIRFIVFHPAKEVIHIDIKDGKIWIQYDGTEDGVANELVALGVPKQDIVLAFQAPYARKHMEFAVG